MKVSVQYRIQLKVSGIALLLLYLLFNTSPTGVLHHATHNHESHHDELAEANPCHIAIFHPGLQGGCNHKYHFTQGEEKCPLCDLVISSQQVAAQIIWPDIIYADHLQNICSLVLPRSATEMAVDNKGPPAVSA